MIWNALSRQAGPVSFSVAVLVLLAFSSVAGENGGLIKNGSFEGSFKYWMPRKNAVLDKEDPAHGQFAVRINERGGLRSASFTLLPGKTVTIGMYARAEKPGKVSLSITPSERHVGQKSGYAWNAKKRWVAEIGTEWKRVQWDIKIPKLDKTGSFLGSRSAWWNKTSWIMMVGGGPAPIWIDGVSVAYGKGGKTYEPHTPIEVTATAPNLPGYTKNGNLLEKGAEIEVSAFAFNPSDKKRSVKVRWELLDYEGKVRFGDPIETKVEIEPLRTVVEARKLKLTGCGLMLARVSALGEDGGVLGKSDQPLTALAFPKNAPAPNPAERFGGSLRSTHLVRCAQKIGLGWTRWYPQINWSSVQPEGPDKWKWPDATVNDLHAHGISVNAVLYSLPKWAKKEKHATIPKDMAGWGEKDARWDDLSVVTGWDKFVVEAVKHYADKSVVWEFWNEPDIHSGLKKPLYARMLKRTYKLIKKTNPQAKVLINETWPGIGMHMSLLKEYGDCFDVFTFHNYTSGPMAGPRSITDSRKIFKSLGLGHKEIWFNEGWTYIPTSEDYPAPPILDKSPPWVAHMIVRCAASLLAAGMDKLITFHIGYGKHGKSWWDWVGSGTEWWDDHGNPTVAAGVYNVLADQIGLSDPVTVIHAEGALIHVFQDKRNDRGVAVAWGLEKDTVLQLPLTDLIRLDVMGNQMPLVAAKGKSPLKLTGDQKPCYVFSSKGISGDELAKALIALKKDDRVVADGVYRLPPVWEGSKVDAADGNPYVVEGKHVWRLDRVWPDDPMKVQDYRPLVWSVRQSWHDPKNSHGGQPGAKAGKGKVSLGARTAWGGKGSGKGHKLPALVFVVPANGTYRAVGELNVRIWHGRAPSWMRVLKLDRKGGKVEEIGLVKAPAKKGTVPLSVRMSGLKAGQEIVFVPKFGGGMNAGNFEFRKFSIRREQQ